jgi:hypothetical protein
MLTVSDNNSRRRLNNSAMISSVAKTSTSMAATIFSPPSATQPATNAQPTHSAAMATAYSAGNNSQPVAATGNGMMATSNSGNQPQQLTSNDSQCNSKQPAGNGNEASD